ncbi:MAG: tRNA pseudouridine(38-40) synthase TruA [Candidatus Sericytochromatia bacterium]
MSSKPLRYKLVLEYDGSSYSGWQQQKNALTVQGSLIEAMGKVLGNKGGKFIDLQGSGRTDAGVHAFAQVAHLDCETTLGPDVLLDRINAELPPSINVLSLEKVGKDFHARHSADSRQYLYRISRRRNVFESNYAHWVKGELDLGLMHQAAGCLVGMHDFGSFSSKPEKERSTMVLIESYELMEEDEMIFFRLKASHFLWNMVRNLVGVLIEVGKGRLAPEQLEAALQSYNPRMTAHRAPACGLFLERVEY